MGAVRRRGPGDGHHQPGVVDLAVVVADRAGEVVGAEVGCHPRDAGDGTGACAAGTPMSYLPGHRHRVVQQQAGTDVGALPGGGAAGRGTAPVAPGAARAGSAAGRAPRAPRGPARSRTSPGSAGRRARACDERDEVPLAKSRCSTQRGREPAGDGVERGAGTGRPRLRRRARRAPPAAIASSAVAREPGPRSAEMLMRSSVSGRRQGVAPSAFAASPALPVTFTCATTIGWSEVERTNPLRSRR